MSAVVVDGGVVHYEYLGRGKPLILIHGWLGSWRYWMPTMAELSDTYRTYALDLWGFGDTDKARNRYNVADYVNLVSTFMDELGIQHAPLVGHSLGALVALDMALMAPERVDRVALVSLPFASQDINRKALLTGKGALGGSLFGHPPEYEPVITDIDKTDKQAIDLSVSSLNGMDLNHKLALLRMPALIVFGTKDAIITPREYTPILPSPEEGTTYAVRTMFMDESRHFPMLEESRRFNRLLRDFLAVDLSDPQKIFSLELKEEWRRKLR
jgi:pimeloyl-ACP methyl ester carboxylesterase